MTRQVSVVVVYPDMLSVYNFNLIRAMFVTSSQACKRIGYLYQQLQKKDKLTSELPSKKVHNICSMQYYSLQSTRRGACHRAIACAMLAVALPRPDHHLAVLSENSPTSSNAVQSYDTNIITRVRLMAAYLYRWRRTLIPPPRPILRPKLFLLLDIRRRNTLHKTFTALRQLLATDRGSASRQGIRILRLLRRREAKLKAAGMSRLRDAARAARELERRKEACFERWNLFVMLRRVRWWKWT